MESNRQNATEPDKIDKLHTNKNFIGCSKNGNIFWLVNVE